MKRKHSILWAIVLRFILYSIGIEMVISICEDLFSEFVLNAGPDFSEAAFHRLLAGGPYQFALVVGWNLFTLLLYAAGVLLFALSIRRKIARPAQRMAEGFHEVANGNLDVSLDFETEREFSEMQDAFNLMTKRLRTSEERRSTMESERMRLFSHIAHDLKTPMTTISGYAGALAGGMVEGADKQREYLLAIKAKSAQMNRLTEQLLSYSKLGASGYQMRFEPADLAELLRVACASLFGDMEAKRMELELALPERPVSCMIDPHEIGRAVSNLLANAIRHNPPGTMLSAGLMEDAEAGAVEIQIEDSGPDVPEAIAKSLFEPFVSGSDARNAGSGTGLGLAIVKKIAEQHSGEAFLSPAPAPYTKMFVIRIPK